MSAPIPAADGPVRHGLLLAAGPSGRFRSPRGQSKLLEPVLGRPLIIRAIEIARDAGITTLDVVLGYQADRLQATIERHAPPGLALHSTYNPYWDLENGVSVSAARGRLPSRFAVMMGDQLYEPRVLRALLDARTSGRDTLIAVDPRPASPEIAVDATKVRLRGSRITAIGKALPEYDALATGLFVCERSLFPALDTARDNWDTTLIGGIRILAERGMVQAVDIGDTAWCDIDTMADLVRAELLLGTGGALAPILV